MSKGTPTPGPWRVNDKIAVVEQDDPLGLFVADCRMTDEGRYNARLIAAAPELLEAAEMLEAAELGRQGCEECEGEGEPEACGICFPSFDDARVKRRLAIEKAHGRPMPHPKGTE